MTPYGRYLLLRCLTGLATIPLALEAVFTGPGILRHYMPTWCVWLAVVFTVIIVASWPHSPMAGYRLTHQPYRVMLTGLLWVLSLVTFVAGWQQVFFGHLANGVLQSLVSLAAGVLPVLIRGRVATQHAHERDHEEVES